MASVFQRTGRDGKPLPKWGYHYRDHTGKRVTGTGTRDKSVTRKIAEHLESQHKLVVVGLKEPGELAAETASRKPLETHIQEYELHLTDKGDTSRHAQHTAGAIRRTLASAGITRLAEIGQEPLQGAARRLKERTSARTANHALGAVKGWIRWLYSTGRLTELPRWLGSLKPFNEATDRKRVRRSLTTTELHKLIVATEGAPPIKLHGQTKSKHHAIMVSGPERAALYRFAAWTGLRANEIRTLDPDCFRLDGDDPYVIVRAGYSKHRREDLQPVKREHGAWLRAWLTCHGLPTVPEKTAKMLRGDLELAGIPYQTTDGVVDFHSLRATYITLLIESGVDPKRVQTLARHSTITLTMDKYVKVTSQGIRDALEGQGST